MARSLFAAGLGLAQSRSAEVPVRQLGPATDPSLIELSIDLETFDQRDQTPSVQTFSWWIGSQPKSPLALDVANTAFGLGSNPAAAGIKSFDGSMAYLQSQTPGLTLDERRMVLSLIGGRLNAGYSTTVTNNPNMESIFQNARNGGHEGGICGDIHTYLSLTAPRLGAEAAGTHTAYWWIDGGSGGGHAVAHFRDPTTGEYYLQNYSNLYATGQKTLPNLLEVSTRILGFAWTSSVESMPGTMHLYVPRQARWISERIFDQAAASVDAPKISLSLGSREQRAGLQYGWANERQQIKGYALGARFDADEGVYSLEHLGAAYSCHGATPIGRSSLAETGYSALLYGSGSPIQPFGEFGPILPGLDDGSRQLTGQAAFTFAY